MRIKLVLLVSLSLVLTFQNCSNVAFNSPAQSNSQSGTPDSHNGEGPNTPVAPGNPFIDIQEGLSGGHFDLDTSHLVYAPAKGTTDKHVHQYDDKFNVTYADYFNLRDPGLGNISEFIPADTKFILIVANASLSPKGILAINGQSMSVLDYQKKVDSFLNDDLAALTVYNMSGVGAQKLSNLKIGFDQDSLANGGLIGTDTSCVVRNDPGPLGEYRNGALIIQAIDIQSLKIDPQTKTATPDGGLLWESTIFWHWDNGCY